MTRRRILKAGAALGLGSFVSKAHAQSGGAPLRIGVLIPLSGPGAYYGKEMKFGADTAVEHINAAGGVNGQPIEVVIRDDKGVANDAVAFTRELAGSGVNLLVGGAFTTTALGPIGTLKDVDAVFITTGAIADSINHQNYSTNCFRLTDNNYIAMRALARISAERYPNITKWGAVMTDVEASHDAFKKFTIGLKEFYPKGTELTIVDPVLTRFGDTDFRTPISNLMASEAKGIFLNLPGEGGVSFFQQARPFGLSRKIGAVMEIGSEFALPSALKNNTPPNFWTHSHWYYGAYLGNPMGKKLYDAHLAATGDKVASSFIETSYAAINVYAQAVAKARKSDTASVIEAMRGATFETPKGQITFRKEDNQKLGEFTAIRINPSDDKRGFAIADFVKYPNTDLVEPPSPGKAIEL